VATVPSSSVRRASAAGPGSSARKAPSTAGGSSHSSPWGQRPRGRRGARPLPSIRRRGGAARSGRPAAGRAGHARRSADARRRTARCDRLSGSHTSGPQFAVRPLTLGDAPAGAGRRRQLAPARRRRCIQGHGHAPSSPCLAWSAEYRDVYDHVYVSVPLRAECGRICITAPRPRVRRSPYGAPVSCRRCRSPRRAGHLQPGGCLAITRNHHVTALGRRPKHPVPNVCRMDTALYTPPSTDTEAHPT
jgi:hypothetical protein